MFATFDEFSRFESGESRATNASANLTSWRSRESFVRVTCNNCNQSMSLNQELDSTRELGLSPVELQTGYLTSRASVFWCFTRFTSQDSAKILAILPFIYTRVTSQECRRIAFNGSSLLGERILSLRFVRFISVINVFFYGLIG